MDANPANDPFHVVTTAPERAIARRTRAASSPPAPASTQTGIPVAASRRSSSSSKGSGSRLAAFSPTPRLTAIVSVRGPVAARATQGFAPLTPSVSSAQAAASSGSGRSLSPPYARLSNR